MEAVAPSPDLTSIEPPISSAALLGPRDEAPAKGKRRWGSSSIHFALLLAITALGGVLRFVCLDRPSIWGDEAATFGRVCGTFGELMKRLQSAGFAPVHYELYWWIGQHALLTPFMMRLVPAVTGTLMIPAMYWLAAQLIGRRAALLTALLTATSAYLLNYSRDAKMYSPFWFFAVLNVAALLWWLRVRTPLSWCLWIASGTAMVGFDALGWITVAIEVLIVLTARQGNWLSLPRLALLLILSAVNWSMTIGAVVLTVLIAAHGVSGSLKKIAMALITVAVLRALWLAIGFLRKRKRAIEHNFPTERFLVRSWIADRIVAFRWPPVALFILGVMVMFAGPFGYYYDFNRFFERVDERGWGGTGIDWVEHYDAGRTGPSLVGFTASAFLTSWEWPRTVDQHAIAPRTLRLLTAGTLCIAGVLALGLLPFPWARRLNPLPAIGGWRSALWLIVWLAVPPYAFYCVSIKDHVGPQSWLVAARDSMHGSAAWIPICIGVLALGWFWVAGSNWRQRVVRVLQFLAILCITLLAIQGFYLIYPKIDAALSAHSEGWREHGSVWMPRYVAVILPAVLIVVTVLLWRLPTRPLRWGAVSLLIIVNLSVHACRVFAGSEPPTALMAHDILDSQNADNGNGSLRAYFQSSIQAGAGEPGTVGLHSEAMRYYITILSPRTTPPNEVLESQMHYRIWPGRMIWMTFTGYIINEVRRSPRLRTFITWERLGPREIDLTDKPLDALEPDWRLASEQIFAVRDHWRWLDNCVLRRRVYVRTAASQP